MKNCLRHLGYLAAAVLLAGSLAAGAARAAVVVTFSGQVTDVESFLATPPSGVGVGSAVSGTVVYHPAQATEIEVGPSERGYVFPPASGNEITITIGPHVWKADLQSVSVCDDQCDGDYLDCGGISSTTVNFPGNLGSGILTLEFADTELPYDLINGHDLPDAAEDIQFGAAQVKAGSVSSSDGSGFWAFLFDVSSQTLPVHVSTWGEIKALYARP